MVQKLINTLKFNTNTDDFKLATFNRVQKPYEYMVMPCTNFDSTKVSNMREAAFAAQCAASPSSGNIAPNSYAISYQGNLRNITGGIPNQCPPSTPVTSTYCRTPASVDFPNINDNPNVDIRTPTFMPNPSLFGITPNPVYRNLLDDPITSASDLVDPVNFTLKSLISGSITYGCVGYDCGGNQDSRRPYSPFPEIVNPQNQEVFFPSPFLTTANSIVALGPTCAIYYITPIPATFAEINVNVTTNPGTPSEHTETLTINNFEPYGSATSEPYRFVFGRIETIQTTNMIQGPAIQGAIVICGGEGNDQFVNMQCLIDGVNCFDDQKVDFDNSPGFSESTNPWTSIMANSAADFGNKRTRFFPHPYDYMVPDPATNGKHSDKFIPGDHGQTMWYYVDTQRLINDFRAECNGIGMGVGVNGNQQNANLFCNLEPHACLPGLGGNINGGLKLSVPCKVSQFMNLASGLYDHNQFPYPYGYSSPVTSVPEFNINAQFLQWMQQNATSFMPTNQFLAQNNSGTPTSLYDPTNPQFWLGYGSGDGGSYMYYSPTTSDGKTYFTNSNVELILDIVGGTFLEYTASVAQGKINVDKSSCNIVQGGSSTISVSISNLVSPTVFDQPTEYALSLNCNALNQESGLVIDVTIPPGGVWPSIVLEPGQTIVENFTVVEQSNLGFVQSNQISCIATLRYATVLAPDCDTQTIDCRVHSANENTTVGGGGATPFVPPPNPTFNCQGFCDWTCRANAGLMYEDGCFWFVVLGGSAIVILGIVTFSLSASQILKQREEADIIDNQSQDYIKRQLESSEGFLKPMTDGKK
jgi:hypothetical protein